MDDKTKMSQVVKYFEGEYSTYGFEAQRRFPNEELCRFMGRNYFPIPKEERSKKRILEVGCGSGANLWMIAREGFSAIGLDSSKSAISLCEEMLTSYNCSAELLVGDMTNLKFKSSTLDAIVDVFSSHCLDQQGGLLFLNEVYRTLKPGGKFFSYFPSTRSDTWTDANTTDKGDEERIDFQTLDGLHRKSGPYYTNFHSFRFLHPKQYQRLLENIGFKIDQCETLTRTYENRSEIFEFIVIEGTK